MYKPIFIYDDALSNEDRIQNKRNAERSSNILGGLWTIVKAEKLNASSVLLEASRETSGGARARVLLQPELLTGGYALFPGQVRPTPHRAIV